MSIVEEASSSVDLVPRDFFGNYKRGWFEDLLDFDIGMLKPLDDKMNAIFEREKSPELRQWWIGKRELLRFSYYFIALRWFKFVQETSLGVKLSAYLEQDFKKHNIVWEKDKYDYVLKKMSSLFSKGAAPSSLDGQSNDATTSERKRSQNLVEYYKRLFPALKSFVIEHRHEVQRELWSQFSKVVRGSAELLGDFPFKSLDYSFKLMENFFIINELVRPSFFEERKMMVPLLARQTQLSIRLNLQSVSAKIQYARAIVGNTLDSAIISFLTAEEQEALSLKCSNLTSVWREKYPAYLKRLVHQINQLFALPGEEQKLSQNEAQIQQQISNIEREKEQRNLRIQALIQRSKEEVKGGESVSQEVRQSRLQEAFTVQQREREERRAKEQIELQKELEDSEKLYTEQIKEISERKQAYEKERTRLREVRKADSICKKKYLREKSKEEQFDLVRWIKQQKDEKVNKQFDDKMAHIEKERVERLAQIEKERVEKIAKEARQKRMEELLVFEKSYLAEQEKNAELIKKKKKVPVKKVPEQAKEKMLLEELAKMRLEDEEEKIALAKSEIILPPAVERGLSYKLGEYMSTKQSSFNNWVTMKGQKLSLINPAAATKRYLTKMKEFSGEVLLFSAYFVNTLLLAPFDNYKIINQLQEKGSLLYERDLRSDNKSLRLGYTESADRLIEVSKEPKLLKQTYLDWETFETQPKRKGNIVRLLKHNVLCSDALCLFLFKGIQDKLMFYSQGEYQNWNNFTAAAISGAFVGGIMNPLDMFKTLYVGGDLRMQYQLKNIYLKFSTGMGANIVSSGVFRGIQLSLYEYFKRSTYMRQANITQSEWEKSTTYKNFNAYNDHVSIGSRYFSAVAAGLVSSVVAYPLDTAKRILYTNIFVNNPLLHLNSVYDVLKTYRWYSGFRYNAYKIILQPFTLLLWDHVSSKLANRSQIQKYLF